MDKNYEAAMERPSMNYEVQVREIHNLIDNLENKVEHISLRTEMKDAGNAPKEIKPALNTALDEVITRLYTVVNRIQN